MFKKLQIVWAALAGAMLSLGVSVAHAQSTNPLVTAASTETAASKTDLLTVAGLLFVVVLALWGAYKIIGMFGRK